MRVPMAACTAYVAPALALVQNLTPPRSRATAAAVLMLMFNIIGLGLGPLFAGIVREDRKSVVSGKSVSVRVDLGGRRILKQKNNYSYRYAVTYPIYIQLE